MRGGAAALAALMLLAGCAGTGFWPVPTSNVSISNLSGNWVYGDGAEPAPGPVATELFNQSNPPGDPRTLALEAAIPVGRVGRPEEVAHAVAMFLHRDAGFITGQLLYVCGGVSAGSAG